MEYKNNWQRKLISWTRNKRAFYSAVAIILLLILAGILFAHWQAQQAAKKAAELKVQKAAQVLVDKKKNATYSRLSFFLTESAGSRGAFNFPSYLEGYFRLTDTSATNKKMTIMYVKNSDYTQPLMYIRFDNKTDFKLAAGEVEIKTDSTKYSYAYYFYPVDTYPGADKADFSSMQSDFKDALATFGIF
jgi:hypothetical protein